MNTSQFLSSATNPALIKSALKSLDSDRWLKHLRGSSVNVFRDGLAGDYVCSAPKTQAKGVTYRLSGYGSQFFDVDTEGNITLGFDSKHIPISDYSFKCEIFDGKHVPSYANINVYMINAESGSTYIKNVEQGTALYDELTGHMIVDIKAMAITFTITRASDGNLYSNLPLGNPGGGGGGGETFTSRNYLGIVNPATFHATANPDNWTNDPFMMTDPGRPVEWVLDQEVEGYYYIDFGNTTGNASDSNTWGTPSSPRLTAPATVLNDGTAGSTVRIEMTGVQQGSLMRLDARGDSEDNMIFIVGDAVNPVRFLDTAPYFRGCQYALFENLVRGGTTQPAQGTTDSQGGFTFSGEVNEMHHCIVRNMTVENIAIQVSGGKSFMGFGIHDALKAIGGETHSIVAYDLTFRNLGNTYDWSTDDRDAHAIAIGAFNEDNSTGWAIRNIWFLDIDGSDVSGNTIQITGQGGTIGSPLDTLHHFYMSRVSGIRNRQPGIGIKTCSNVYISQCSSDDINWWSGGQGDGFGSQYNPNEIWVMFSTFNNVNHGLRTSEQSTSGPDPLETNIYFIGNKITNVQNRDNRGLSWNDNYIGSGIYFMRSDSASTLNRYCAFNTFYNCHRGISVREDIAGHNLNFWSNAVHIRETTGGVNNDPRHIAFNDQVGDSSASDYNVFVTDHSGLPFATKNNFTSITDLATWRATTSGTAGGNLARDQNSTIGSALFNSPDSGDLIPQAGSALLGAGRRLAPNGVDIFARYLSQTGLDIYVDAAGTARQSTPSAGAYEVAA